MGRCKAALPLPDPADTFLSRIIRNCLGAGVSDVVVVTGADPEGVRAAWQGDEARVRFVHNAGWPLGQLSSLLTGLDLAATIPLEAAVVFLVDAPLASSDTVATLVRRWR